MAAVDRALARLRGFARAVELELRAGRPATTAALDTAERRLGVALGPVVRALYLDGRGLTWRATDPVALGADAGDRVGGHPSALAPSADAGRVVIASYAGWIGEWALPAPPRRRPSPRSRSR